MCTSANEELGTLAENNPLTVFEQSGVPMDVSSRSRQEVQLKGSVFHPSRRWKGSQRSPRYIYPEQSEGCSRCLVLRWTG